MPADEKSSQAGDACLRELETLIREITQAFYDLRGTGEGAFSELGSGSWELLQVLATEGPMTMSGFARRRSVSRQYIQKVAATPIREKWITLEPNPADRRAPLMTISPEGERRVRAQRRRLQRELRGVSRHFVAGDVANATATVALMRSVLDKVTLAGAADTGKTRSRRKRSRRQES
jgi:DNA-binding MarR family transcriptional regulator